MHCISGTTTCGMMLFTTKQHKDSPAACNVPSSSHHALDHIKAQVSACNVQVDMVASSDGKGAPDVPLKRLGWSGYVFSKYFAISQESFTHFPSWFSSTMTGTCTFTTKASLLDMQAQLIIEWLLKSWDM